MQIREQGQQVQLIRSPYDKEKKRCVQKVIATFKRKNFYTSIKATDYLSDEQLAILSDNEKIELADWLTNRVDAYINTSRSLAIGLADNYISDAAEAINEVGISAAQADAIWEAISKLQKALRKSGNPKPKADEKLSANNNSKSSANQGDLLEGV